MSVTSSKFLNDARERLIMVFLLQENEAQRDEAFGESYIVYNWIEVGHKARSKIPVLELLNVTCNASPSAASPPPGAAS